MPTILITGSNRGLGLEWTRQYAAAGWRVFATCRHPAEAHELQQLASQEPRIRIERLDITDSTDICALRWALGDEPIDVLLNNAGIYLDKGSADLGNLNYADWARTLEVNTLGAVRVSEAFVENVAKSARRLIVAISSHMGSIAEIDAPGSYFYRSSKAALNAAFKGLSLALKVRGIGVLILHPGWVKTRMGGGGARLTATESVACMRKVIETFTPADSGRFLRYDGSEIPW